MKKYQVIGFSLKIFSGILNLSESQAKTRKLALEDEGGGKYRVISPVEFKAGEIIGFDGEVPKALVNEVVEIAEDVKISESDIKKEVKPKPRVKAKSKDAVVDEKINE